MSVTLPKLFVTGATGYIGGDALSLIVESHPDWDITCLVRNSDKGAKIAQQYSRIKLVYGDLDSEFLIEKEVSKADIVYHFANCDHEASARAISRGLAQRTASSPGYWIHTCGTMILAQETFQNNSFGEQLSKVYNDWDGVQELISFPHEAPHRNVDEIVLAASTNHPNIRTAIVCPPTIYGLGRGPDNQRGDQAYKATAAFLSQKKAFTVGKGQNIWHQIHVHDLSQLYLLLGEAAVSGGSPATWDNEGYYLAENGEFIWGDILQEIANVAHKKGFIPSAEMANLSPEESGTLKASLGTSSRGVAIRAKKLLNWQPKENSLKAEIPTIVDSEARKLGIVKDHAQTVEME